MVISFVEKDNIIFMKKKVYLSFILAFYDRKKQQSYTYIIINIIRKLVVLKDLNKYELSGLM